MAKILLVEDDTRLSEMVQDWLTHERHMVDIIAEGREGLDRLRAIRYDLVILDWELPGLTGIEICQEYRRTGGGTPILFLTGRTGIADKESGFNTGADDYLTKPFHSRELVSRVRALLRRPSEYLGNTIKVGCLELESQAYKVMKSGKQVQLAPREFALLEFLMRSPGVVFSAEALLERLWHTDSEASADTVRVCVKRLRSKLGEPCPLQTVFRQGYKVEAIE